MVSNRKAKSNLTALSVLTLITSFLIFSDPAFPREQRLRILRIYTAEVSILNEPFDVSVSAEDTVGIQEIEINLDGQKTTIPARGTRRAMVTTELTTRTAGYLKLTAMAIGVDGTRGEPMEVVLGISDHSSDSPAEDVYEEMKRVRNPFALYEPGNLYEEGLSTRDKGIMDRTQRKIDNRYGRLGQPVPGNWWKSWKDSGAPQPFDWASNCWPGTPGITPNGEVLECWLQLNPQIWPTMVWVEVNPETGYGEIQTYNNWTPSMRHLLYQTFYDYYVWMDNDLSIFPGQVIADPPVNQVQLSDDEYVVTAYSRNDAMNLYIHTVAHSLAVEIGGFVPWSVLNYSVSDLYRLFSLPYLLHHGIYPNGDFIGYWPNGSVTPATPTNTFKFLVDQDFIRMTHYGVISRFLKWGRDKMIHFAGHLDAKNVEAHWLYRGDPPVSRTFGGTPHMSLPNTIAHYSAGCHGTAFFAKELLRAVNIPVSTTWVPNFDTDGGHRSPVFHTIGRTMSHGDDVYGMRFNIPSISPSYIKPDKILITPGVFTYWFHPLNPDRFNNVSRQIIEIALDVLPNKLLNKHCDDVAAQLSHAESSVYETFDTVYTLQQLESLDLWERLNMKVSQYGCGLSNP